jgi:DNA end-binding protein Ku
MAQQLIESFSGNWKPEKYKDTYRDALCAVIEAKRKGKEVHVAAEPEEDEPADLMAALRASLESAKGGRRRPRRSASSTSNGSRRDDLSGLTKSDLEERARKAKVEGRSKMSKDELIEALRAA